MSAPAEATTREGPGAWGPPGLVFAAVLLAQLPTLGRAFVPMDEGHLLAAVDRLLAGEVLYRDIHTGIGPGIYWLTSLVFAAAGEELLVTRWLQAAVNAATAALLFALGRRAGAGRWALLPPALYTALVLLAFPGLSMLNYSPLATLLALAALWLVLRLLEGGSATSSAAAGAVLAAAMLTKQNFGVLALLGCVAGYTLARRLGGDTRSWLRPLLPGVCAGLVLAALVAVVLLVRGNLADFVDATFLQLLGSQVQDFSNPIPPFFSAHPDTTLFLYHYMPSQAFDALIHGEAFFGLRMQGAARGALIRFYYGVPILLLFAGPALCFWTRQRATPAESRAAALFSLFAPIFFLGIYPSATSSHLAYVAAPCLLWAGVAGERAARAFAGRSAIASRAFAWTSAALVAVLLLAAVKIPLDVRRRNATPLDLQGARVSTSAKQASLHRQALAWIDSCAAPGEPIFTLPVLPGLYFFAQRPNPTPYDLTIPGNVRGDVIAERLAESGTRCVVWQERMYIEYPAFALLFPRLDVFLRARYVRVATFEAGGERWHGLRLADGAATAGERR